MIGKSVFKVPVTGWLLHLPITIEHIECPAEKLLTSVIFELDELKLLQLKCSGALILSLIF